MTIQDFLNMDSYDISKLNFKEGKKLGNRINTNVKSRFKTLNKYDVESPALKQFNLEGGIKKMREFKNLNQLRNYLKSVKKFFEAKTSTGQGFDEFRDDFKKRTGYDYGTNESTTVWELFNKLLEEDKTLRERIPSDVLVSICSFTVFDNPERSFDELLEILKKKIEDAEKGKKSIINPWENDPDFSGLV